jgi:hypothetical protein
MTVPAMIAPESPRIARERRTVGHMIDIYCGAHHQRTGGRCAACQQLHDYAMARLDHCPYGAEKPTCKKCPVHCYRKDVRVEMRRVMAYAGPRMLLSHPVLAILHLVDERRAPVPRPVKSRAE